MSFFTGLVTGAATAVTGNLQAALDRRENEMSKARAYMRTRQAQKAELADAHDKRATKALNRFINEFDGNVAKGLAAYKAVGGDVDAAEAYLVELDGTRAVGLDYDINEKFKFDNIDLEQFTDLSRSDAASSIGMSTTGVGASAFKDTSGLAKIGLGLKNTQGMADEINKLIPPRTSQAIDGLESATFDPTGTKSATQFQMTKQKFEQQMKTGSLDLKNQIKFNILEIGKLGDSPEDEDRRLSLLRDNEALTKTYAMFQEIDNTGKGGMTTSGYLSVYTTRMKEIKDNSQFGRVGNKASVVDTSGTALTGQDATNYYNKLRQDGNALYVEQVLMNADGSFKSASAEGMVSILGIDQSAVEQAIANINATSKTTNGGSDETGNDNGSDSNKTNSVSSGTQSSANYNPPSSSSNVIQVQDTDTLNAMADRYEIEYEVGTSGMTVGGNTENEAMDSLYNYIFQNPADYINGIVKTLGSDFLVENLDLYKEILKSASTRIKDEELRSNYEAEVIDTINSIPKSMTSMMRNQNATNVAILPETYVPTRAEKLMSDDGGFMGNYLYEDANGVQYISPQLPSKFGIEVK